ncbi:nucleolar protein,Nop52-domain-containing protein [Mycena maculata]|uniref:Nucleolar protein,Nop52-domain-containing protein n=1 Tax=Mycena maculata TaxID=230809 RepID=A0AAD7IXE7_9AGAR|nr:nucleolar protein,Nop52-domain-containing protein [Mycena maculata]
MAGYRRLGHDGRFQARSARSEFEREKLDATTMSIPLAKHLASTDKKTRDKAVMALRAFLSDDSQEPISKADMDKLWKGIFYCFWMSDKPLVQQALASELAEVLSTISSLSLSLSFLRGFWEATVREWSGIDRLRLDKYYMLVRRFVNATFRLLGRSKWDKSACETCNDILTLSLNTLFSPADIRVPTSLAYHLADIFVEELEKALTTASEPMPPAPLSTLLSPFFTLAARTPTSATYKRIQSELFTPLFSALSLPQPEDQPPQKRIRLEAGVPQQAYPTLVSNACFDNPSDGRIAAVILRKKLLRRIFEIASEPDTRDSSRRKMYALFKESTDDDATEEG